MQQFIASRRQRMLVSLTVALAAVGVGQVAGAVGERSPKAPSGDTGLIYLDPGDETPPTLPNTGDPWGLYLEPVAGLTTARHPAPRAVSIPVGTVLRFTQAIPWGMQVAWEVVSPSDGSSGDVRGTREDSLDVSSADIGETLRCPVDTVGSLTVSARLFAADGSMVRENTRTLKVLDVSLRDITVEPIQVRVDPVDLHEGLTNEETMHLFFEVSSIANLYEVRDRFGDGSFLRPLRRSQRGKMQAADESPRRFVTSINRPIEFRVAVDPVGMAPLIEWRIDSDAVRLGAWTQETFSGPGQHTISVGPTDRFEQVDIEIYSVEITSHEDMVDIVQEGTPITFQAVTDPPGFEDDITWVSSTKDGTASPVLGTGPSFTVTFEDTFADDPANGYFQWLGVRADNTTFGQDQKPPRSFDDLMNGVMDAYQSVMDDLTPVMQDSQGSDPAKVAEIAQEAQQAIDNAQQALDAFGALPEADKDELDQNPEYSQSVETAQQKTQELTDKINLLTGVIQAFNIDPTPINLAAVDAAVTVVDGASNILETAIEAVVSTIQATGVVATNVITALGDLTVTIITVPIKIFSWFIDLVPS